MIVIIKKFPFIQYVRKDDVFEFFFKEASDEEKQLIKLTAPELAKEYKDAKTNNDTARCVLIEHYLNMRLFKLQSNYTLISGIIALIGAIAGAFITAMIK